MDKPSLISLHTLDSRGRKARYRWRLSAVTFERGICLVIFITCESERVSFWMVQETGPVIGHFSTCMTGVEMAGHIGFFFGVRSRAARLMSEPFLAAALVRAKLKIRFLSLSW